jgi:transposase
MERMQRKSAKGRREKPLSRNDLPAKYGQMADALDALDAEGKSKRGRKRTPAALVLKALNWMLRTGSPWRDLPAEFGKWQTIYGRYRKWVAKGWISEIAGPGAKPAEGAAVAAQAELNLDSTTAKAHRCAAGARRKSGGPEGQNIGAGRGGRGTKIHVVVDGEFRALLLELSGADSRDAPYGKLLIEKIGFNGAALNADKAYYSQELFDLAEKNGGKLNVKPKSNSVSDHGFDAEAYKGRNVVERFFSRLKDSRRVFSRYDKLSEMYEGFVVLASHKIA